MSANTFSFNFVYLTKNLLNGKEYVGIHSTNNLNDGYIGSGIALKRSIKKYGKENFISGIIEFCDQDKLKEREIYWISKRNTYKHGYNLTLGGESKLGYKTSEETKQKISKANSGKSSPFKGKTHSSITKEKCSIKNKGNKYRLGKKHSEETRQKIKDNIPSHNGSNNPMFGKTHSLESKEKMKLNHANFSGDKNPMYGISPEKITCEYCKKLVDVRNFSRWHGKKCKSNFC